jgi:PatG Domain
MLNEEQSGEDEIANIASPTDEMSASGDHDTFMRDNLSPQQEALEKPCNCRDQQSMEFPSEISSSYVYAIGNIEPRFPNASVEREFQHALRITKTSGKTDQQAKYSVLSERNNRYLAREMCWVLVVNGVDTYALRPHYPEDFDLLIEAARPRSETDIDIVIGTRGPIASPEMCDGRPIPIVIFDQIYSDRKEELKKIIPRPEKISVKMFDDTADDILSRILSMVDNVGATDRDRALNFLAVRSPEIYVHTTDMYGKDFSFRNIEVRPSPIVAMGQREIDVILFYAHRNKPIEEKCLIRVNVGKFPYITKIVAPYITE